MNNDASIKIEFDMAKLERKFGSREKAAQAFLDNEVIKDTDAYVRYRSGALARSVQTASKVGQGLVVYDTPYAKRVYYDNKSIVSKDVHRHATALWFEASKKKNIGSWMKGVKKILKGGNAS